MMKEVRVRYAPSPTGLLHIGNARTAIFNYLFAKHHNGKMIIRIEDTDVERNVKGGEESQLQYLRWLGVEWDESVDVGGDYGPYRQLERLDLYKEYAHKLVEMGLAYKCYCTADELSLERESQMNAKEDNIHYSRKCLNLPDMDKPYAIRFKVPENVVYEFNDMVRGNLSFSSSDIGDWVILRENGIPTYNFAVVVDDHLMKISHVLRGEEHIPNTPKQIMVYQAFDWEIPIFCHMTLIVNENKKKLSKRDASIIQFISQYAELGYLPDAIFNFIALLGWSPENNEEIMDQETIIQNFNEKRLSKSPALFDKVKLAYINNRYLKNLELSDFIEVCMPHLVAAKIDTRDYDWVEKLCSIFQERVNCGADIVRVYQEFFSGEFTIEEEADQFIRNEAKIETIQVFLEELKQITNFDSNAIALALKETQKKANAKGKLLYMPCRIATTGSMHGPDLPKSLELLGKDKVINRIESFINKYL